MQAAGDAVDAPPATESRMQTCDCLLCDQVFQFDETRDASRRALLQQLHAHLVKEHRLVVADIDEVPDLPSYARHWKARLADAALTDVCHVIKTNTGANDVEESVDYFLLSPDSLPEEQELRLSLSLTRLHKVLAVQELERTDVAFSRQCLFCSQVFTGNRSVLLDHLKQDHHFNVGHPDNIVFVHDLLDAIQAKLDGLRCLFCDNKFTDWEAMKEHMRKKGHKQLDPECKDYDRFYLVNYLEAGRTFRSEESLHVSWTEEERDTSDWVGAAESLVCLFCRETRDDFDRLTQHMQEEHCFSFQGVTGCSFYQKVRFVNLIRSCVREHRCFSCGDAFPDAHLLLRHLKESRHASRPPSLDSLSQAPLVPAMKDDLLLSFLPDDDDGDNEAAGDGEAVQVISEEVRKISFQDLPIEVQQLIRE